MNIKEIFKTALNLIIICAVAAGCLCIADQMTRSQILANEKQEKESMRKELLPADDYQPMTEIPKGAVTEAYQAIKGGKTLGYIIETSKTGYSSTIKIMYAVNADFNIMGVKIISSSETPGLGERIKEPQWLSQFKEKNLETLTVKTAVPEGDTHISAITGATISSRAVTEGIKESLEEFKKANKK